MLDIKLIRESPKTVENDLRKRGDIDKIKLLNELIALDKKRREIIQKVEKLKHKRNVVTREVAELKKNKKPISKKLKEMKEIPEKIKKIDLQVEKLNIIINSALMRLPNTLHSSVPVGASEEDNKLVREWGEKPKFDFQPKDHIDLALMLDLIDIERASKVAGARFYYLKNELVLLNQALIKFALDFMKKKGFTPIQTPYLLRRDAIAGATDLTDFEQMIYKIEKEDLYLLATSEHALLAMHMGEILDGKEMPLRYCGISPCFRKEAGAHGRDTKGIFRTHQFEKVEQFVLCKPQDSWQLHDELIKNAEEFFQLLRIPYRIMNICTGDIGTVAAKKYDLETWLPGQGKYREVVSCSNCTDYQARRSGIRYRDATNEPTKIPHTLNSTLTATERTLIAIMENYQTEDSIKIPLALQPYMNGLKEIKR